MAFALALGKHIQSPLWANSLTYSEFDVFMDAIKQRVAMKNLFADSLEHPELQFIFLTPRVGIHCFLLHESCATSNVSHW